MKVASEKSQRLDETLENQYTKLYREHPFQTPVDFVDSLNEMLKDSDFMKLFDLSKENSFS